MLTVSFFWHSTCIYIGNSFKPGERKMKAFVFLLLVMGSLSVFAETGEDRALTHDGVICQAEEGKTSVSASTEEAESSSADSL